MKKQNKKVQQNFFHRMFATRRNAVFSSLAITALLIGGYVVYSYAWVGVYNYRATVDYASANSIRTLILDAVDDLTTSAPVDPKTGDIYFPEAKLYLPRPAIEDLPYKLTYNPKVTENTEDFAVVNHPAIRIQKSKIQNARTSEQVFEHVAAYQACLRGVLLTYDQAGTSLLTKPDLKQTIMLPNGRTLYAYIEKDCQLNTSTAFLLKELRPY